ncbi:MAG: BatD family protein [Candidatus Cloacimonetes bacterium]|nr:BatD family protein [Candidatus Cloacimonadota bacterium]
MEKNCSKAIYRERYRGKKESLKKHYIFLYLFLLTIVINIFAQEIVVESFVDRGSVGEGEVFRFNVEIRGQDIGNIATPELRDMPFTVLGSSRSTSTSISIVNMRQTTTRTERITYNLQAGERGTFQIPPVLVTVNNTPYYTRPINITVVEASASQQQQQQQQQRTQQQSPFAQRSGTQTEQLQGSDIFFRATADKTTVYRNEMIIVHYKLYTQAQLQNINLGTEPAFTGFWREDLYQANRIQMQREVYEGRQYNTLLIRSIALFPSRDGTYSIPSFDLNLDVVVPARSFWDFNQTRSVRVSSNPIEIRVNPLPAIEAERNFIGAVGRFDVSSRLSANEGETGNSLTYRLVLSGVGNFNQTLTPRIPEVPGLRFLTPEIEDVRDQSSTQFSGRRTFIFPVILQDSGVINIPEIEISWFDPASRRYQSRTVQSETINVRASEQQVIATPGGQQTIRVVGQDIQFIETNPSMRNHKFFYQSIIFWIIFIIFPLSLAIHYYYILDVRKLNNDLIYSRNRRASAAIRKYLKEANVYAKNNSIEFYDSAYIGLNHFLTDKLNLSRGAEEKMIYDSLHEREIKESLINDLQSILQKINFVKFSNANIDSFNIKEDIGVINNIIQSLMTELNKKKIIPKKSASRR